MKFQSNAWFARINHPRQETWDGQTPPAVPVYPTIAHALHPKLQNLFLRIGTMRDLDAGQFIVHNDEPVDTLALVLSGITAREVGRGENNAMAIAIAGRLACGNLNFFTAHPCIGSYFALVPSRVVHVRRDLLRAVLEKDFELLWLLCMNAELCTLSDRLSFASMTMLGVESRLKLFFMAWAANYSNLEHSTDGDWLVMPPSIQRRYLQRVVNTSRCTLDAVLKKWKSKGMMVRCGQMLRVRSELFAECFEWLSHMEEPGKCDRVVRSICPSAPNSTIFQAIV